MVQSNSYTVRKLLLGTIHMYQRHLSPLFPARCIYMPTCSEYARQAIERYGAAKGSALAVKRVLRCHPFHKGGYDPVPEEEVCGSGS